MTKVKKISFVTACMGRLHHLKLTLPYNLQAVRNAMVDFEWIIVDWDSKDGLGDWLWEQFPEEIDKGEIVHLKFEDKKYFDRPGTRNRGIEAATGDVIMIADADNFFSLRFILESIYHLERYENVFVNRGYLYSVGGKVAAHRKAWLETVGLFDESLQGWGWEDTDWKSRAIGAGLFGVGVDHGFVGVVGQEKIMEYIDHPDSGRMDNEPAGTTREQSMDENIRRISSRPSAYWVNGKWPVRAPRRMEWFDIAYKDKHLDSRFMTMRVAISLLRDRGLPNNMVEIGGRLACNLGVSSKVFGHYLRTHGHGRLTSMSPDKKALSVAKQAAALPQNRHILIYGNVIESIKAWPEKIDFLYLDGGRTLCPESQEETRLQTETALPKLHDQSIVLMDDYIWGQTNAKTIYAQKVMEDAGWSPVMYEHQIVWVKGKWTGWPEKNS
jgi:predicted O-methyltransferase YrrM/GT2 family glycosyltransferase